MLIAVDEIKEKSKHSKEGKRYRTKLGYICAASSSVYCIQSNDN